MSIILLVLLGFLCLAALLPLALLLYYGGLVVVLVPLVGLLAAAFFGGVGALLGGLVDALGGTFPTGTMIGLLVGGTAGAVFGVVSTIRLHRQRQEAVLERWYSQ